MSYKILGFIFSLILVNLLAGSTTSSSTSNKEVVCFIYHRFNDSRYPSTNTSTADFEKHLAYLHDNHFTMLSFADAIAYLQSDEPARKTACLTIDDGFKSFYKNGLPLLKKYKMPATLFINTETVGGGEYMDWSQLETVSKTNIEIANHTHSHAFFMNEHESTRYQTFKDELTLSQSIIKNNLHINPVSFSYPYGEFDNQMMEIVKDAGFKAAASQNSGVWITGMNLYSCPRFPMSEAYASKSDFIEKANMHALKINTKSPDTHELPLDKKPTLTLTFDSQDLQLSRLQCFVQGASCSFQLTGKEETTITLKATKPITRRRTLYTITIPDKAGNWHWYSHLWINEKVK